MLNILAPCKINLFLAIRGKDATGYHEIETVFARSRAFQDELIFERADTFSFECDSLPAEGNTVPRAVEVLKEKTGREFPYRIRLEKGIPLRAGLGGGSSDAATTLLTLNRLENLNLSKETLMELGAQIGMDVPFFVAECEVALGTHYGEKILPLPGLPPAVRIELETGAQQSTQDAFAAWDAEGLSTAPSVQPLLEALQKGEAESIVKNLHNDFEPVIFLSPRRARILAGSGGAHAAVCVDDN